MRQSGDKQLLISFALIRLAIPTPLYSSDSGGSDDRGGNDAGYRSVPNENIASMGGGTEDEYRRYRGGLLLKAGANTVATLPLKVVLNCS